jgi:hypothetical protein
LSKKCVFYFYRKALKEFTPIKIVTTESEELKSILNEIDVLKKLSSKSEYVINYLDSFSTDVAKYRIYHIVTNLYEVNNSKIVS